MKFTTTITRDEDGVFVADSPAIHAKLDAPIAANQKELGYGW